MTKVVDVTKKKINLKNQLESEGNSFVTSYAFEAQIYYSFTHHLTEKNYRLASFHFAW